MSGRVEITVEMVERARRVVALSSDSYITNPTLLNALEAALNPRPQHHPALVTGAKAAWNAWDSCSSDSWNETTPKRRDRWIAAFADGLRAMRWKRKKGWLPNGPWDCAGERPVDAEQWNNVIDRITGDADER